MAARGQGFALGDFDTSWMLDDRFRRLAERLPDFRDCGAAKNMYWEVVAASWREARRVPLHQVFSSPPEDLVAALVDVGLLDHQDRIRRGAYNGWVGKAITRRDVLRAGYRIRARTPSGRAWIRILAAFGGQCAYCGRSDEPLQREHRVPLARGGTNDVSNIVPACGSCNRRKATQPPDRWPLVVEPRWVS